MAYRNPHAQSAAVPTRTLSVPAVNVCLEGPNYLVWKTRMIPYLKASRLLPILDGSYPCPPEFLTRADDEGAISKTPNPAFADWHKRDQMALGWVLNTSSDAIVARLSKYSRSAEVWAALENKFAAESRGMASSLRLKIQMTTKGNRSVTEFLGEVNNLSDQLSAIGETITDNEYLSYLLRGLGSSFANLATAIFVHTRSAVLSRADLNRLILAHEAQMSLAAQTTATHSSVGYTFGNASLPQTDWTSNSRTRRNPHQSHNNGRRGASVPTDRNQNTRQPICQLCRCTGHGADHCQQRYDPLRANANPPKPSAKSDSGWILDSGFWCSKSCYE